MRKFAFKLPKALIFNGQRTISRGACRRGCSDATESVAREGSLRVTSDKASSSITADFTHSNNDKDDFTELGETIFSGSASIMKMGAVTSRHLDAKSLPVDMQVLPQTSSSYAAQQDHTVMEKRSPSCTVETESKTILKNGGSTSVVIKAMPSGISLFEMNEAASVFGEISCSSLNTSKDGCINCHICFKNLEAKESALASSWLKVKGHKLTVHNLHIPEHVKVRICNINMDTDESAVYSVCLSLGSVVSLAIADRDTVDVIFSVEDAAAFDETVKRLNSTTVGNSKWSACIMPIDVPTASEDFDCNQSQLIAEIITAINGAKRRLQMQKIYLNDLENLHQAVIHLKNYRSLFKSGNFSSSTCTD